VIIIDILRAARVFIAFTFPQPCECAFLQNSDEKESFLPYKSSAGVLLEMWRPTDVVNFGENDANLFICMVSMLSNLFCTLSNGIEAA